MEKIIEVKNLTKIYPQPNSEIIIFENLSFEIKKGDFVSITGPSGSGKTTLLNIISALDSKYSGEVFFMGTDISKMKEEEKNRMRLKEIGFVFQFDSLLEDFNILENIEMPALILNDKKSAKKGMELLKKWGMEDKAYKKPQELSGGEKQRTAILRAIRNNPSVIIADEPTGNLDHETAIKVMNDFKKLNQEGSTVVMVTHNMELARIFSNKIYSLSKTELKKIL